MDIRKVKKLIELLDESGIAEIEITEGEESVRISRYSQNAPAAPQPVAMAPAPTPIAPQAATPPTTTETAAAEPEETGYQVIAPMVGTYYSSSSPGADPFVKVGDQVNAGDILCIVEAMKMMNQIESEVAGVVKSIKVENGDPVEYGQVLFVIDQRHD
ncbi:MAG: acetyl-CoA carboxylase biotin carboxyl carrier protein [Woeseia sp.]|nr:acetyl-CoA carboxylase biotin carboxyl carrier protein [Woeseia sp.]MBT8096723.1 acetyl-CoA carboxylase biotin carboxyl carrier protein [Woeseia sp.]NNE61679.1 acetyl-CoA carboxylase biotin carboxyl carrier protein [Woeseia sp.]NNL54111.1 acetyl-CoA carboxylase biotin carboxyl carrier protein [Woeseia sp.]